MQSRELRLRLQESGCSPRQREEGPYGACSQHFHLPCTVRGGNHHYLLLSPSSQRGPQVPASKSQSYREEGGRTDPQHMLSKKIQQVGKQNPNTSQSKQMNRRLLDCPLCTDQANNKAWWFWFCCSQPSLLLKPLLQRQASEKACQGQHAAGSRA